MQPNFNPEVGFVRRGDMSQYAGEFTWAPRIERTADPEPDLRHQSSTTTTGSRLGSIETRVQEATAGISFQNNGSTNFTAARTFDRLFEPFDIRSEHFHSAGRLRIHELRGQRQHRQRPADHRERQRRLGRVLERA